MPKQKRQSFTQAFKLAALSRMATAPSIVGLAQQLDLDFFAQPCATSGSNAGGGANRARRHPRGDAAARRPGGIERMCRLAGISRAGYDRQWQASKPRQEETGLRDEIQRLALAHRHYGYRRITVLLQRSG